ncbi:MAG: NADPH:quinone reductase-like Zn-dependent oxidoreductase [Myxococcota bacterium]|jgi:NADPH:quinone reductase-like Zn-dependent oxidoreductase
MVDKNATDSVTDGLMRAMGASKGGVTQCRVPIPAPGRGEIRVKVVASAVNAGEEKVISGDFVGRFLHVRTSPLVLGWDVSGTVEALGEGVTDLAVGADVWGHLAYSMTQRQGAFAEYVTVPRDSMAAKPNGVSHDVAAAAATVAMTALQSIRDEGRLAKGGTVMIVGAGGGVGAVAVGIAKRLGAHVTGVCSTRDVARVETLGADVVLDRKKTDPLEGEALYDVIFDTPNVHSFGRCARLLRPGGAYVTTLPDGSLATGTLHALFTSKRCRFVQVASKRADLELVGGWLDDGLEVPIDSRHDVANLGAALERQTNRERVGRVVVNVAQGWPI